MSNNLDEDNVAGHDDKSAYLVVRRSDGTFSMVQGVDAGDYAAIGVVIMGGLGGGRKMTKREDIAVTNGNTVEFELTVDLDGDALPTDMEIQAIIIQPHDGAAPPVAVSNRWIFSLFTHSDREVDDIFFSTDRTARPATADEFVLNSKMGYLNEEGQTEIPCSLYIETGDTDATFTVKVIFA